MTNATLISTIPAEALAAIAAETTMEMVDKAENESLRDGIAIYETQGEASAVTFATALMTISVMFNQLDNESTIDPSIGFDVRWAISLWSIGIKNCIVKLVGRALEEDARTGGQFLESNLAIAGFIQNQAALESQLRQALQRDLESGKSFEDIFKMVSIIAHDAPSEK